MTIQKPITLQEAKSIARHLGLTLRQVRSGDYRVNFRDGDESTAATRSISKTPLTPPSRWLVSASYKLDRNSDLASPEIKVIAANCGCAPAACPVS
jgi:hypothetical protein